MTPELQRVLDTVPPAEVETGTVGTTVGGTELEAYLAAPAGVEGRRPGVLVLHDWSGMTDHVRVRAQMLARLGHVALAGDVFGKDDQPTDAGESQRLAGELYGDVALFRERVLANLELLRADPRVDPARVVVMGYCLGGSGALEAARAGADVAGVVSFHGGLNTGAPAEPGSITAPLLVLTGADDPMVPVSAVEEFEDELRTAGAPDWQVVTYSGALHAFAVPGVDAPEHGAAYQETADRRSWRALQDFLGEVLA
ncbi:dienelactone hydrolase family protein [Klenkia sp. PcliD-1-E]|uniref:dienelactone hydrolase family protein n=1 Tax=Klenkia sp. PcliD-1-E TaxID=2954492 RepID=UPI0020974416|nr:dienelactone hydrolase family protein [Klenkia sp. PcliD-1-E]MCO7219738.1 dienelactone hydrolase family protein [Klenkia sp. PcliD-1-E]